MGIRHLTVIRQNATKYELIHELKHFGDFRRLGYQEFMNLEVAGQESSVYRYMQRQNWLTPEERYSALQNGIRK